MAPRTTAHTGPLVPLAPAVIGLLVLAAIGAAVRGSVAAPSGGTGTADAVDIVPEQLEQATPMTVTPTPTSLLDEIEPWVTPSWLVPALWTVLGLAVAAVLVLLLRRLLSLRQGPGYSGPLPEVSGRATTGTQELEADLTDSLTRAQEELRRATEPRDAVVSAWVALEEGAAEHGSARDAAQTPTEFTLELLARTHADPAAVEVLRVTYLHARFSPDPVTPAEVERAAHALSRIESTWART